MQVNNAMVVGPFVLPYSLLLSFAAVASTLYVGKRSGRNAGIDVESVLWHTLLVGLVVARLAFVWERRSAYLASPLDVLDIRDGGWSPTAGFVGAWLFALSRQGQLPAAKKALWAALLTGTILWAAGAAVLSVRTDTGQELPALSFTSLEGQSVTLAEFKGKKVGAWLQARKLPMRNVLIDANKQAGAAFKQRALPTTLFFDGEGRLVSTRVGELSSATLTERLQALTP